MKKLLLISTIFLSLFTACKVETGDKGHGGEDLPGTPAYAEFAFSFAVHPHLVDVIEITATYTSLDGAAHTIAMPKTPEDYKLTTGTAQMCVLKISEVAKIEEFPASMPVRLDFELTGVEPSGTINTQCYQDASVTIYDKKGHSLACATSPMAYGSPSYPAAQFSRLVEMLYAHFQPLTLSVDPEATPAVD